VSPSITKRAVYAEPEGNFTVLLRVTVDRVGRKDAPFSRVVDLARVSSGYL